MAFVEEEYRVDPAAVQSAGLVASPSRLRAVVLRLRRHPQTWQLVATVLTTFTVFAIFLIQGIVVARILGATGRGEFGTALYFPRDILLYAGLLGAIEIVTGYAAKRRCDTVLLKYSAARLGLMTGAVTAAVAALLSVALLVSADKQYLIPWCLLCCLFVPFEHVHLTVSSVDRGEEQFWRYNINRLLFAIAFPLLMILAWWVAADQITGLDWLSITCFLWVFAKFAGLLPTLRGMYLFSAARRRELLSRWRSIEKDPAAVPAAGLLLKEGRPYAISMLVSELFDRLDVFLILVLASVTSSGYYFVAVPAAAILIIAPNALGIFAFNAGARDDVRVARGTAARVLAGTALFQMVATTLFALIIGDLIVFFFGQEFAPAIPFALWLLPASAIKGFQQAADGYLKGKGKPMIGVAARGFSILVMLAFVALAWQRFGLISIPMAACLGQAVSATLITVGVFLYTDKPPATADSSA
jgi:O-antigen/teichoic acid export membrane protein